MVTASAGAKALPHLVLPSLDPGDFVLDSSPSCSTIHATSDSPTSLVSSRFVQEPIAVIGMACRLPGGSDSPNRLWEFLMRGGVAETAVPESRFHLPGHFDGSGKPRTMRPPGAMFMENVDPAAFDAKFFNIAPQDAVSMDPQQRILLEVIYEALENAGIPMESLSGQDYGCYVGAHTGDYWDLFARDPDSRPPSVGLGVAATMLSNRVSHFLNIKGPSVPVDTACSSSLVAMDIACKALHNGEINGAIIAAASLILNPEYGCDVGSIRNTHSPTGQCHTFDTKADGYVRAEGTNAVILKRLDDALQDGDPIRAVIRGIANNHNGRTPGIASPSAEGQAAVVRQAYVNANITDYSFTGYVECHGTGTLVGDPVEATGASSVFAASRPMDQPLRLGSIKSNIGHSELPAGLSGLMKAVMILETGQIPGNPTFLTPNPHIDFKNLRLQVSREATNFPNMPFRRVGVNCFGFGGSNSHAIMDEPAAVIQDYEAAYTWSHGAQAQAVETQDRSDRPYLLCFSANDETSLRSYLGSMTQHLDRNDVSLQIRDLAYTLGTRRSQLFHRAYIVGNQLQLSSAVYGKKSIRHPQIGFVFTGQGAQWPEMGRELMKVFDPARTVIRNLDSVLQCLANPPTWSLYDELTESRSAEHVRQPEYSQPLVTALQIALLVLFRSWGVTPRSVVGHSSGEIAAAFAAGYLTEAEAIVIAYHRGQASKSGGCSDELLGMLAVGLGADEALPYMQGSEGVQIACYNSPKSVTLSGTASALHQVKETLTKAGAFARMLQVDMAYHSTFMREIGETYEGLLINDPPPMSYANGATDAAKMFSSVSGRRQQNLPDVSYWKSNMVSPVRFDEAVRSMLQDSDVDFLVEIGPSGALKGPISQIMSGLSDTFSKTYIPSLSRGAGSINSTLAVAGQLYLAGLPIDLAQVNEDTVSRPPLVIVDLPNYSWNHTTPYWSESSSSRDWRFKKFVQHDLLGSKVLGTSWHAPTFKKTMNLSHLPWLQEHRIGKNIEFPKSGFIAMAVEATYQITVMKHSMRAVNELSYRLRNIRFEEALILEDGSEPELHLSMHPMRGSNGWYEFLVLSAHNDTTTAHASGEIHVQDELVLTASKSERAPLEHTTPGYLWHKAFAETGLDHEPAFQRLQKVETRAGKRHCRSLVTLTDPPVPYDPQSLYPIHPAALEGLFQAITPALCAGIRAHLRECLVPSTIDDMIINPSGGSDTGLAIASSLHSHGHDSNRGDASLYDETGSLLVQVQGVSYAPIHIDNPIPTQWLTRDIWIPDILALTKESLSRLGSGDQVATILRLVAGAKQAPSVLELDLGWGDGASIWFHREGSSHAYRRYSMAGDASEVDEFKKRCGDERNTSFHVQMDLSLVDDKFDLVIIKATSYDETFMALKASKRLLSSDGHVLVVGWEDHKTTGDMFGIDFNMGFVTVPFLSKEGPCFLCTPGVYPTARERTPLHVVSFESNHLPSKIRSALRCAGWDVVEHNCPASDVPESSTVLILDELFAPVLTQVTEEQWLCLHRLITNGCKLLWVTQGAQWHVTEPDNALVSGLFRSIRSEDPSATLMTLDVESRHDPHAPAAVVHALSQLERPNARWATDNEYAERDGIVNVHRVEPFQRVDEATEGLPVQESLLVQVEQRETNDELPDGHVEVEIHAVGLNQQNTERNAKIPVCLEGAGIIRRVGNLPLDLIERRVAFLANGILEARIAVPVNLCYFISDTMSFEQAAGVPVAFCTAFYALYDSHLNQAQTVLIHGSSDVRIASVQFAKYAQIDIFVTADSEEERDALHQLGFPHDRIFWKDLASEIVDATKGRGIDLIVSSVMDDTLDTLWESCADDGTLVQLGKRAGSLSLAPFDRGCSYRVVDFFHPKMQQTQSRLLKHVFDLIHNDRLTPITSSRPPIPFDSPAPKLTTNTACLIIGGLKGLCGSLAIHLAFRGIRHLVIMSRSGCHDPRSQETILQCRSLGCTVYDCRGDVTRIMDVRRAFTKAPVPVRGIVHGAMLLRDRPYDTMTVDEFHQAIEGKIHGAWNLHNVAMEKRLSLDFFLLLSSISSVVGSKGQANYAAANSFLDSFAAYRQNLGEKCVTVALGVVEDVGVVAESDALTQRHQASIEAIGIPESALHSILDCALHYDSLQPESQISQLITGLTVPQDSEKSGLRFDPRFSGLFVADSPTEVQADPLTTALQQFSAVMNSESRQGLLEKCLTVLSVRLAQMLRWSEEQVEPGQPLSVYGLDSLAAVELRNWIRAEMGAMLKTKEIVEAASLIALGEVLVVRLGESRG
ncbi:ketoacyl-synt-domain-containing protein [Aspergillus ellipticus CBS 707.79]|uniref:Ketoacyl-synt-domain-containing protein n=1 Tax=Aspergillus ellipticus CBS 707.79 TaxID=1448320 RepID=A0A319DAV9_9EURO|nr:ketoacyl-synt-domain-containing protein [Aspergillus ellipticus CBS 707.79]